eukprot:1482824-Alexandrium_andersonii.AAC.1
MSASLVGSEMCIRDRNHFAQAQDFEFNYVRDTDVVPELCFASAVADAVSYTHLTLPTICSV